MIITSHKRCVKYKEFLSRTWRESALLCSYFPVVECYYENEVDPQISLRMEFPDAIFIPFLFLSLFVHVMATRDGSGDLAGEEPFFAA